MTYTLYLALLITLFFCGIVCFIIALIEETWWDAKENAFAFGYGGLALIIIGFMVIFLSPNRHTIIENDYYAILNSRPECVKNVVNNDFTKVSLDCAEDYINYRTDSLNRAERYFEIKEQVLNKLKETK